MFFSRFHVSLDDPSRCGGVKIASLNLAPFISSSSLGVGRSRTLFPPVFHHSHGITALSTPPHPVSLLNLLCDGGKTSYGLNFLNVSLCLSPTGLLRPPLVAQRIPLDISFT